VVLELVTEEVVAVLPPVPLAVPDELWPLPVEPDAAAPPLPRVVLVPVLPQPCAVATATALIAPKRSKDRIWTSAGRRSRHP
jgi:hypothetical protein